MTETSDFLPNICVSSSMALGEALERLDQGHKRILLVVDVELRLLGVVTDSNFRRAMLARIDFSSPLSTIMTAQPVAATLDMGADEVLALMERTHCHEMPVLDRGGRVVRLLLIEDLLAARTRHRERVAVVMAGGLGERLRPLTDATPKPLLPVGDKPILFTLLDRLLIAEFDRIYITVNYKAEAIVDAVSDVARYRSVTQFVREDQRLGTAGALSLLPERPKTPFIVTNADLLTTVAFDEMLRFHERERNLMTVALREELFTLPYGIATLEGTRITGMLEKPTLTHFINAGVYVLDPAVLDRIPADTHVDAPNLVTGLIAEGRRVGSFPVREYWIDIGLPHQLEQARRDYPAMFGAVEPIPVVEG